MKIMTFHMEKQRLWELRSPKSARDFVEPLQPVARFPKLAPANKLRKQIHLQPRQTVKIANWNYVWVLANRFAETRTRP